MASHLTILIKRIKAVPYNMKHEPVFKGKLINLAEYIRDNEDYTDFEKRKATALLKVYELDYLLHLHDNDFEFEIIRLTTVEGKLHRTCIRCGRTLTNSKSIRRGYGEECWDKVRIPLDHDLTKWS